MCGRFNFDAWSSLETDRPAAVWLLCGLLAFLGVRGVFGGGQFLLVPSGRLVGLSTAALAGTPFRSFLVPGAILLSVLGIGPLLVAYGVYRGRRWAWFGSVAVAVALLCWVLVEGLVIGFGERLQYLNVGQAIVMLLMSGVSSVRTQLL